MLIALSASLLSRLSVVGWARMRAIMDVAAELNIPGGALIPYGWDKAKIDPAALAPPRPGTAKLVLVSAITPTRAGEGKTTTSIGLADALRREGQSVCLALREPSLGPCMGVKGGGTGGGKAQLTPSSDINLHFTGDFHAITAAHNLLSAVIDNHLHFRSPLQLDARRVLWRRVLDVNDRSLRQMVVGLNAAVQGPPRETGFDITAASELMAMLCLAEGEADLRARIDRTLIGFDQSRKPVVASQLGITGAMLALLRDALKPNLVQTLEGTPAIVHGGPFANIAHGCNSLIATRTAMRLADWAVTEAGFGFDLGAEKFFDIKCAGAGLNVSAVVLVATVRALKMHGGVSRKHLDEPNPEALERGLPNLHKHIENVRSFGHQPIVAINRFASDADEEIATITAALDAVGVVSAATTHYAHGGEGARALARAVREHATPPGPPAQRLYPLNASVPDKILAVASTMYGARSLLWTKNARDALTEIERLGYDGLPVCVAKTQKSLSDDPKKLSRPSNFDVTVADLQINAGAGFLVVFTGDVLRMPGLPRRPRALDIDLHDGTIVGVG
ncbi:MAG: formate--tetrahydrofolate ligase [Planctomycetota bacterium]